MLNYPVGTELILCTLGNFSCFLLLSADFSKSNFQKISFIKSISFFKQHWLDKKKMSVKL